MFVTASDSKNVIVWNATNLLKLKTFRFNDDVNSVKFSKNMNFIGVGGDSMNRVYIINVGSWTFHRNQTTNFSSIYDLDFN